MDFEKKILLLSAAVLFAHLNYAQQAITSGMSQNFLHSHGLRFTPNKGQIADIKGKLCPDVLYKGETGEADIYLRKTGISYVYSNMSEAMQHVDEETEKAVSLGILSKQEVQKFKDELLQKETIKTNRVDMDFEGCSQNVKTMNADEVDGYNNYYYAHCPNGVLNVKQYNKVTCKNIYDGIDIVYSGGIEKGLKYDLVIMPHADPNQIKLHWKGAEELTIKNEKLVIKTNVNEFTESIPKVYQVINGEVINVKTKYILTRISKGEAIINFSFSIFNPSFPLVVDPWVTYYGGNQWDYALGITNDVNGNVLITGRTSGGTFPVNVGASQGIFGGSEDAFVVKFSPAGSMLWATYYGGNSNDWGSGIATDLIGNVVITGWTRSVNFPVGQNGGNVVQQGVFGGPDDAIVVKFNSAGSLLWATFYGGNNGDQGVDVAIDMNGNVVITGITLGGTFPIGKNGGNIVQQGTFGGAAGFPDAFVVKFTPNGAMLWATFFGGNSSDRGFGISTDFNDNVLITGHTQSANFPVGQNGGNFVQQAILGGNRDAFVVKFAPTGAMLWATFYGGNAIDDGNSIATDQFGNVVITGSTTGGSFFTGQNGGNVVYQGTYGGGVFGGGDGFVVKFKPDGSLLWASYLGGSNNDYGLSVRTDAANNDVFVSGDTYSLDFPVTSCAWQQNLAGGISEDGFVTHLKPNGSIVCSSYVGGPATPNDEDCRISIFGCYVYTTGSTGDNSGGKYPVTPGAWQTTFGGASDAFVGQLYKSSCGFDKSTAINASSNTNPVCNNTPINFTGNFSVSCDNSIVTYTWSFPGGTPASSTSQNPTGVVYTAPGNYTVQLKAKTSCDSSSKDINITVSPCSVCNLTTQFSKGTANCAGCLPAGQAGGCKQWIMINATGGTSPYSYSWPDGYDKRYKNQLCPGNYTVNIKDKNGCSVNINLTAP